MDTSKEYATPAERSTPNTARDRGGIPPDLAENMTACQWACRSNEQSVRVDKADLQNRKRLNRLHRIVTGASDAMQTWHQRRRYRFKVAFITLTYRPGVEWEANHIRDTISRYRSWAWRRGFKLRGLWVMEMQQRGVPHYHIMLWIPKGLTPPMPDKQRWWPHGDSNCQWLRKPTAYMAKYTSKIKSKGGSMPKGARIYGVIGAPIFLGWWRAPGWLRQLSKPGHDVRRGHHGWWVDWSRGWAWRSPWVMINFTEQYIEIAWRGWTPADVCSAYQLQIEWRSEA